MISMEYGMKSKATAQKVAVFMRLDFKLKNTLFWGELDVI